MIYKTLSLGKLCSIEKGITGIMKAVAGPYPMVTLAEQRTSHTDYQFDAKAVVVPLISSTGHGHASMKRVHYQEGKFALGSILCALIPNDETELNARFLHNYLSFFKDSLLVPLMRGAANVSLSIKSISGVTIPLPPLDDQLAINELVDIYSLKTKAFLNEFQTQQTLLTQLRQAILQEAVQGRLTEKWRAESEVLEPTETGGVLLARIRAEKAELIRQGKLRKEKPLPPITDAEKPFALPEGWVWCRLGEIVICERGRFTIRPRNDPSYFIGPYPFIQIGDLPDDGGVVMSHNQTLNEKGLKVSKMFPQGTIAVAIVGATIGNTGTLGYDMCFTDSVVGIKPSDSHNSSFVNFCLINNKENFRFLASAGGGQPNIKLPTLNNAVIAMPPLAEQQAIVEQVEQLLRQVGDLEAENKQQQAEVGRLMQAVLREAFAGKTTEVAIEA